LHACTNGADVDVLNGQPIDATKPTAGVGTDGGSATVIVALEEEVTLDDTVATYVPALPYVCGMANAVD
jgi:hypothetical protein